LELQPLSRGSNSVQKLEQELDRYLKAIEPVFNWTPTERSAKAMYFLREQQRPRRQSVIDIAEEISGLAQASYAKQLDQVNSSQAEFGTEIRQAIGAAFVIGLIIAVFMLVRMKTLEERAGRHQAKTEQTEEELRALSMKLMQTQEEERKTISRELHDEVGQTLTALRMGLGSLDKLREDESGFHEQVGEMKALAESALRAVRDIAVGLRPSVLDLGLVPALQWQARRFSKYSGVPATVHNEGNLEEVPEAYRTCIYRVVQECLTNAVKHSAAKAVRVEILESGGRLRVAVQDDGSGMRVGSQRGGLGLIGMEERVRELGGTLTMEPAAGGGTSVVVNLAMPNGAGEHR
jgi:signal transduction histidine kinase